MITISNLVYSFMIFCFVVACVFFGSMACCILLSIEDETIIKFVQRFTIAVLTFLAYVGFAYLTGYIY